MLFTFLYFSDPSGANHSFLSPLLLLHRSRISAATQGLFFWRCLPGISQAVSIPAVLKVVIIEPRSVSSLSMMVRDANLSPISINHYQHKDQNKWTEAWDCHKLQVPGLSYNWWGFQARDTLHGSTDNSSTDKVETGLEWQEYFAQFQDTTDALTLSNQNVSLYSA